MQSFTTDRLTLRDWSPVIADPQQRRALEATLSDILTPDVLAPLPEPLQLSGKATRIADWMSARAAECTVFTIAETGSGAIVGLLLLAEDGAGTPAPICHVGYLLGPTAWGKGYATEVVAGLVATLRGAGPRTLRAGVGKGNAASARVLEKAGFHRHPGLSDPETDMFERRIA
ncbi:GNAT family N-acetyltransferase [Frigidibacter sp. ROC022]|uniref:GNAT family N-acetyltransferase n=1 Tax=Frigidibacter sp. ROC022 TaxID=2971796 RepID=UPI00215A4F4A|nr:GNAT family N-acetyltransferase [Frigidibacter sp. ROC022]MCR8725303.1 GNAT family N-acetyltransferase [Frigidibacter sp. ROC022]